MFNLICLQTGEDLQNDSQVKCASSWKQEQSTDGDNKAVVYEKLSKAQTMKIIKSSLIYEKIKFFLSPEGKR